MITQRYMLLCDDVRKEDNGKMLLLGVYTPDMTVPQLPFVAPTLAFFFCLEADRPGNWSTKFKLQHMETGQVVFEGMGGIGFPKVGAAVNFIKFGNVQFVSAGSYVFSLDIEGQEPIVNTFNVIMVIPGQPGIVHHPGGR